MPVHSTSIPQQFCFMESTGIIWDSIAWKMQFVSAISNFERKPRVWSASHFQVCPHTSLGCICLNFKTWGRSGQMFLDVFWQVVNPPIQILLCFLGDAYNLLVQGPDASVVEGSSSAMLLAVLLQLLLTASLSTVLAIRQTLSSSAAEFWHLGLCATCLCLADSEPRGLSLPGNLGKAFSSGVSVEIWSSWSGHFEKADCHSCVLQYNVLCAPNGNDVVCDDCASCTFVQGSWAAGSRQMSEQWEGRLSHLRMIFCGNCMWYNKSKTVHS